MDSRDSYYSGGPSESFDREPESVRSSKSYVQESSYGRSSDKYTRSSKFQSDAFENSNDSLDETERKYQERKRQDALPRDDQRSYAEESYYSEASQSFRGDQRPLSKDRNLGGVESEESYLEDGVSDRSRPTDRRGASYPPRPDARDSQARRRPPPGGAYNDGPGSPAAQDSRVMRNRKSTSADVSAPVKGQTGTRAGAPNPEKFAGDLSSWGKKKANLWEDDAASENTMSSGLSPRNSEDRLGGFDIEKAKKTLAYNAGLYGRAQALRREGTAPRTLGIADDLPDRFAFEQLNHLAGMAKKVQETIDHNRTIFERRLQQEDRQIMRKTFAAWRAAQYGSVAKQQLLRRAVARIQRGLLARAFYAWKDKFHLVDKYVQMMKKVIATNRRGLMKRCFAEWQRLTRERWWKTQLETRDSQIVLMQRELDGFLKRPIVVLRRRKLYAILQAWFNMCEEARKIRHRRQLAVKHLMNMQYIPSWNAWREFTQVCLHHKMLLKKAVSRMNNVKLAAAFNKWLEFLDGARENRSKLARAARFWKNMGLIKAWNQLVQEAAWRREKKRLVNMWKKPLLAKAFRTWVDWADWSRRMRVILDRARRRFSNRALAMAWEAWWEFIDEQRYEGAVGNNEKLRDSVSRMKEENERLRRDNERFVRLIDSGEWGRGRVAELVAAGEVMRGERDALLKLIQSLRGEYEAVHRAKNSQEDELRHMKERMVLGGAARNRMLVKGGSSFNALVRAMKQDLVEGGTGSVSAARDPNLLYQVDKLSLDKVTVFPDGELNIQAVSNAPQSAAFSKAVAAGRSLRSSNAPLPPQMSSPSSAAPLGGSSLRRPATAGPSSNTSAALAGSPLKTSSAAAGGGGGRGAEQVMQFLQSLSPAELESVQQAFRAEKSAALSRGK